MAWLRTADGHAHVERVLGGGRLPVFGPATELERWATSEQEASSNVGAQDLALWSTPLGDFRLLHRAAPMACEASAACATYRHSRLLPFGERRSATREAHYWSVKPRNVSQPASRHDIVGKSRRIEGMASQ